MKYDLEGNDFQAKVEISDFLSLVEIPGIYYMEDWLDRFNDIVSAEGLEWFIDNISLDKYFSTDDPFVVGDDSQGFYESVSKIDLEVNYGNLIELCVQDELNNGEAREVSDIADLLGYFGYVLEDFLVDDSEGANV